MNELEEFPRAQELRGTAGTMKKEAFARAYPAPALHLLLKPPAKTKRSHGTTASPKERSYLRTTDSPPGGTLPESYHDRIAFVAKRAGNPFPHMVSVGRALNNDLVIILSTISKLHGYFLQEGGAWAFIDHKSSNGSRVNDVRVKPEERRPIRDGDRIDLGLELQAVFLEPGSLFEHLRRRAPTS